MADTHHYCMSATAFTPGGGAIDEAAMRRHNLRLQRDKEDVNVVAAAALAELGLVHGESAWIAEGAEAFAEGVAALAGDSALRRRLARAARRIAEEQFDWRALGLRQREMLRGLLGPPCEIRAARREDLGGRCPLRSGR